MADAPSDSETYCELDKRWRQACGFLFGGEVGALDDYKEWLSRRADPVFSAKSSISGKEVTYALGEYCDGAQWASFDELDFGKKPAPLALDDLKDIDSLFRAASERAIYAGNVVLGNSKFVEKSANVSDSFYVYESSHVGDSKYIAYSSMARLCECVFGTAAPGESQYMVRCNDTYKSRRCFELWMSTGCSDCHYVFALTDCDNCMFCFSLTGARYSIGNVPLGKEKYLSIKQGLLEQMRSELERKKRLPSLPDIAGKCSGAAPRIPSGGKEAADGKDMAPMEEAFSSTSRIVLGARLSGLEAHAQWLTAHIARGKRQKSVASGKEIFIGDYAKYSQIPPSRMVTEGEALSLSKPSKTPEEMEKITLANAHGLIADVAYFHLDYHVFTNKNIIDCMAYAYSRNAFNCFPCVEVKDSAYNLWPRSSEHLFGCGVMFDSQFCIRCYQSVKLSRCFECDSCRDCSDCYFCHNCENVQNGLFCFNVKNLRYAICNSEVPREQFMGAKKRLLEYVSAGIGEKGQGEQLDIFNLGCKK